MEEIQQLIKPVEGAEGTGLEVSLELVSLGNITTSSMVKLSIPSNIMDVVRKYSFDSCTLEVDSSKTFDAEFVELDDLTLFNLIQVF